MRRIGKQLCSLMLALTLAVLKVLSSRKQESAPVGGDK